MATSAATLPPAFKSLYRLHLRTISAAVLHHKGATRNLRILWRPAFDAAAKNIQRLEGETIDAPTRQRLEHWLTTWNQRIDGTLALLFNSSQSRGLPHRLVRNLAYLVLSEKQRHGRRRHKVWNPQLPPDSPIYKAQPPALRDINKREKQRRFDEFDNKAWGPLGEVVRLAEATSNISLGRISLRRWQREDHQSIKT